MTDSGSARTFGRSAQFLLALVAAMAGMTTAASAHLVESVAIDPRVDATIQPAGAQALPGAEVPANILVTNVGGDVTVGGHSTYLGSIFTSSTVRSWYAVLEAKNSSGAWYPIAGAANAATGYSPAGLPSIASGLAFTATPESEYGVTYPASGDRIIDTKLAGLATASWSHAAVVELAPSTLATLLNQSTTPQIRLRVHIEAIRKGLFGAQYVDVQERVATFGKMLRSQSGTASQIQLSLTTGGGQPVNFDSSTHPQLASLASGASASLPAELPMPAVAPKGVGESDGDYLARLRAAADAQIDSTIVGSFTAGGVATPACWWLLFDNDPAYDLGAPRALAVSGDTSTVSSQVPVLEIAKSGPAEVDAGTNADYDISVVNSGDANAVSDVVDEVDGQAPATLNGFGQIGPGQTLAGTHSVPVPASLPGSQLHDLASVSWTDSAGNDYGPVSAEFTSQLTTDTTPPEAPILTATPPSLTNQPSAIFEFAGEEGGTFRCAVDAAPAQDCISPAAFTDLTDGTHTFAVFQVDDAGNAGSAAGYAWTVDSLAPVAPALSGAPSGSTQSQSASITISGESGASLLCAVDTTPLSPCTSPLELSDLVEGEHTVSVVQRDGAGNESPASSVSWVVDRTAPNAPHLDSTPDPLTSETQAGFGFTGEPGGSFECRIDADPFSACPNPVSYESLSQGSHEFAVRQVDNAGNAGDESLFAWTIDSVPPAPPTFTSSPSNPSTERSASIGFQGEPSGSFKCALDGEPEVACTSPAGYEGLTEGTHTFSVVQIDEAGNRGGAATTTWEIVPSGQAPPLEQNGMVPFEDQVSFLYSGPGATQQGVTPGTIDEKRVSVVRGNVRGRDGAPLPGARVEVLGQAQYGFVTTDADGVFSLAVNGGANVRVEISKDGYLSAIREVTTSWNDYAWADDTVLVQPVAQSTEIDLSLPIAQAQIAQGPVETDGDGSRRATLIFNPGTQATMNVPGTGTVPLSNLTVRATELTVGISGPDAMPAPMAPNIAYTYAAAFTVDQAQAADAENVSFSQPVISYTDNFLSMPVGISVPSGYLNHDTGRWEAEPSGRVVGVLSEAGGEAVLDVSGSGVAATQAQLDALGITSTELAGVAERFDAGQSFWRVPLTHFSHYDFNYGFGPPEDADSDGIPDDEECGDCEPTEHSSIIGVETQSLGESIGLPGTEFSLNFLSRKTRGYRAADRIDLALTKGTISDKLRGIVVETEVAGQLIKQELAPAPNLKTSVIWDRKDGFSRDVNGPRIAHVKIGYTYEGVYRQTERFGYSGNGTTITGSRTRQEVTLWREHDVTVGGFDATAAGLGGWTLDADHYYDRSTGTLYRGDGNERLAGSSGNVVTSVTKGEAPPLPPGYPCPTTTLNAPAESSYLCDGRGVEVGASGNVYLTDGRQGGVLYVDRDGILRQLSAQPTVSGTRCGAPNDYPWLPNHTEYLAVDSAENVYFVDEYNCVIWRKSVGGTLTRITGGSENYSVSDGMNATDAAFTQLGAVAVGPDDTLYFVDFGNRRIRHIAADGTLETIAGNGSDGHSLDGASAAAGPLWLVRDSLAVDADGTVYFADQYPNRVRSVPADGKLKTVAGGGSSSCSGSTTSGAATSISIGTIEAMATMRDGSVAFSEYCSGRSVVRRVDRAGLLSTIAGQSDGSVASSGEGGSAPRYHLTAHDIAEAPDGEIFIAARTAIRSIHPRRPEDVPADQEITVAGDDESELLVFDPLGRQLRTVNAKTGRVEYSFARDAAGRLTAITDGDGDLTAVSRSSGGAPTAITGPFGRSTGLTVDAAGRLASAEDQVGNRVEMTYEPNGLLSTFKLPNGATSEFTYDADGRLVHDQNALGGYKHLSRSESLSVANQTDRKEITVSTAAGRQRGYVLEHRPNGSDFRETTHSDGTRTQTLKSNAATSNSTAPDGTIYKSESAPDPRYGMFSPFTSAASVETPAGKKLTYSHQRSVNQSDPEDPNTLVSQTDTVAVNGKTSTTTYTKSNRTYATSSPAGRTSSTQTDQGSRPTEVSVPGISPFIFSYDPQGRLTSTTQGTRQATFAYDADGDLQQVTDSLGRVSTFDYDAAGRMTAEHLPGGRTVEYTYDANGNVTSIKPPSRPTHNFAFNPLGMLTTAEAPEEGTSPRSTTYAYATADHDLTRITRPDGQQSNFAYDSAGRLQTITDSEGQSTFAYSPTTGNLTSLTSPDNENLSFTQDGSLPVAQTLTGPVSGTSTLTYNNDFQLTSATTKGSQINFTYDADGLRTAAGSLTLTSDPQNGLLKTLSLANATTQITHNPYGEPESIDTDVSANDLYRINLTRDAAGRITTKQEIRPTSTTTWAYNYDPAGRLQNVTKDGAQHAAYSYDANGNRTSQTIEGQTTYATFDTRDRMRTQGDLDLTYNDNGELVLKRNRTTGDELTLAYTTLGDLKSATTPAGDQIEYLLDGAGRRVGKKVGGQLTQGLLYSPEAYGPVAELDGNNDLVARYVYGRASNVPDYMVKGGVTYRLITDQLGSVVMAVNASTGAVAQEITYGPFGAVLSDSSPGFQPFGFAGGIYDADTGLTHFGAREYDAELGRWTAADPIGFGGGDSNLYGYVLQDPVNLTDPSGLIPFSRPPLNETGRAMSEAGDVLRRAGEPVAQFVQDHPETSLAVAAGAACVFSAGITCTVAAVASTIVSVRRSWIDYRTGKTCTQEFLVDLGLSVFPVGAAGTTTKILNQGMRARPPSPGIQHALRANTQTPATGAAVAVSEGDLNCVCE